MSQPPTQPSSNPSLYPTFPLMWNPPKEEEDDDESWEVRAFAEDTRNIRGTTWPPRSYTCTFCRREFRSAQALGGHMNVHRRDRARLQLASPPTSRSQLPVSSAHGACNYTSNPPRSPLGVFENRAGFCLVCQQVASPNCHGVYVGSEPPAREAEPNYLEKGLHVDESGEDGNEEDQVREVELDLELRLGI